MRFCYLGGEERRRYLQEVASPGVVVERLEHFAPTVSRPETIESLYDEALLAPWTVEMAVEAERRGYDAESTLRPARALVRHYGLAERCAGIRPVGCSVAALREGRKETFEAVADAAHRCVDADGADVLVLLCASLSHVFGDRLAGALPVPVVNVLRASVRVAELLVGSRLTHSKIAYPTPPGRHPVVTS
jgi:Asp/Glu/hydantoin racemase